MVIKVADFTLTEPKGPKKAVHNYLSSSEDKFSWGQTTEEEHLIRLGKMAMNCTSANFWPSSWNSCLHHWPCVNTWIFQMKPTWSKWRWSLQLNTKKWKNHDYFMHLHHHWHSPGINALPQTHMLPWQTNIPRYGGHPQRDLPKSCCYFVALWHQPHRIFRHHDVRSTLCPMLQRPIPVTPQPGQVPWQHSCQSICPMM